MYSFTYHVVNIKRYAADIAEYFYKQFTYHVVNIKHLHKYQKMYDYYKFTYHVVNIKLFLSSTKDGTRTNLHIT